MLANHRFLTLSSDERAIVTEIPGTTRDTLTEWIEIAGFPILLTDTAGLRDSPDTIEALGQERTRREIDKSDLIIFMIDFQAESRRMIDIYAPLKTNHCLSLPIKLTWIATKIFTIRSLSRPPGAMVWNELRHRLASSPISKTFISIPQFWPLSGNIRR